MAPIVVAFQRSQRVASESARAAARLIKTAYDIVIYERFAHLLAVDRQQLRS